MKKRTDTATELPAQLITGTYGLNKGNLLTEPIYLFDMSVIKVMAVL